VERQYTERRQSYISEELVPHVRQSFSRERRYWEKTFKMDLKGKL
jgi:hypothetical protein